MIGWRDTVLGDEIELAYGKALPAHSRRPGNYGVYGSNGQVGVHDEPLIKGPGIVVGRKGSVGALAYTVEPFWPIDTTYYVVDKGDHNWRYLYYLLGSCGLTGLNSHSAVPGLNREDVYSIAVRIPPRDVQDDIARVLDCVSDAIELERIALSNGEELLRAVAGELFTRGLRGEPVKETALGPLPESWSVVDFADVREWLQYGTSVHCTLEERGYPVLRIPNIKTGHVDPSELKYADLREVDAVRYLLRQGDLLFIRTNGVLERLGACAVYQDEPAEALFASYLIRARLKDFVDPRYVAYFYGSPVGSAMVAGRATPAADGKYNLNTGTIDGLRLPLPPTKEEQEEIVSVFESVDHKINLHRSRLRVLEELLLVMTRQMVFEEVSLGELDLSVLPAMEVKLEEATV
ncbi:type I restriction enzyme, S subunit [Micromonospora nigra]|uniref:Type I restriction enzyme, S subunit n=1 Tax=Micromonospora nigra TaxID=145857 RepID=A0A1C6SAH4_9ACTN|nr:restriction endonuclease subunit S [Micromonospora nigra]SCL26475.1 type I restriction enzyme, S subunit [Micromonospora nigra]